MGKLDRLKHQAKLDLDLNVKNNYVKTDDDYMKQNTFIRFEDLYWLIEQTEKYQKIEQSWKEGIEENKDTVFFLRKCKEVIEDFKTETRKKMS